MSRRVLHVNNVGMLPALGAVVVFLWILLTDLSVLGRCAQVVLTVLGYLRPRPARSAESALRAAFAELDRDLVALLGDRAYRPGNRR